MPNVQWMSYSFVRLYLSKCDVCVLNLRWINPKRFLIILYIFGSDFYHFVFMFIAYFVLHCLNMFCFWKISVRIFGYSFWLLVWAASKLPILATRFGDLQAMSLSREFIQRDFATHSRLGSRLASREMPRISFLKSFFVGNLF